MSTIKVLYCIDSTLLALYLVGSDAEKDEVNEMKDEQLQNFQHKITYLYIFNNGELVDLTFCISIIVAETTSQHKKF